MRPPYRMRKLHCEEREIPASKGGCESEAKSAGSGACTCVSATAEPGQEEHRAGDRRVRLTDPSPPCPMMLAAAPQQDGKPDNASANSVAPISGKLSRTSSVDA